MKPSFVFLCTVCLACAEVQAVPNPSTQTKADELFQRGNFAEAAVLYEEILTQNKRDSHARLLLGHIALLSNQFSKAQTELIRADLLGENEAPKLLGELYYRRDDYPKAARWFRKAGRDVLASKLEHFKDQAPYQVETNVAVNRVPFVSVDPLPVVKARVNGSEEVNFLIDTGAGELILDPAFARRVGAQEFGSQTGSFAGDQTGEIIHASVNSVQLGEWTIKNIPVALLDTRHFAAAARGAQIDGIIGTTLLYHFSPTLRYPEKELVLRKAGAPASGSGIPVPFWLAGDHLIVAVGAVNQSPAALMLVDSGLAGMGFAAPASTLEAAKILLTESVAMEGRGGGTGKLHLVPFVADEIALGEIRVAKVAGVSGAFPASLENGLGFHLAGLVSHTFLKPFSVTFDFQKMQMFFSPGQGWARGETP